MRKLLDLLKDNAGRGERVAIVRAEDQSVATVWLYDAIDPYWGVSAADFVKALAGIDAATIHLRINSPGGDVFDARAIATAIREHTATVIAHIDGLAASAATYVALAANEVEIADGAMMMIHNAWGGMWGNAEEMRTFADTLDKVDGTIVADYMRKTGKTEAQIREWMAAETWFTAAEALDAGFVDRVAAAAQEKNAAANRWNLAAYARVPAALQAPAGPDPAVAAAALAAAETKARTLRDVTAQRLRMLTLEPA